MNLVLVVPVLIATVAGRPQGYSYPAPSIPSAGYDTRNNQGGGFGTRNIGFIGGSSNGGYSSSGGYSNSGGHSTSGGQLAVGGGTSVGGFTAGGIRSIDAGGNYNQVGQSQIGGGQTVSTNYQNPTIQKHIYVHVAPPDLEETIQQRVVGSAGASQKHYKIIFIKTPSYQTQTAQQIQAQAQNQEKTLIYVLVKRPDDAAQIDIRSAAKFQPSKPEVYFIKYKAQQESTSTGGNLGTVVESARTGATNTGSITGSIDQSNISGIGVQQTSVTRTGGNNNVGVTGPNPVYGPPGHISGPY